MKSDIVVHPAGVIICGILLHPCDVMNSDILVHPCDVMKSDILFHPHSYGVCYGAIPLK